MSDLERFRSSTNFFAVLTYAEVQVEVAPNEVRFVKRDENGSLTDEFMSFDNDAFDDIVALFEAIPG